MFYHHNANIVDSWPFFYSTATLFPTWPPQWQATLVQAGRPLTRSTGLPPWTGSLCRAAAKECGRNIDLKIGVSFYASATWLIYPSTEIDKLERDHCWWVALFINLQPHPGNVEARRAPIWNSAPTTLVTEEARSSSSSISSSSSSRWRRRRSRSKRNQTTKVKSDLDSDLHKFPVWEDHRKP